MRSTGSVNQRRLQPRGQGGNPRNFEHQGHDLRRHVWLPGQGADHHGHQESLGQRDRAAEEGDGLRREYAHDHGAGQR